MMDILRLRRNGALSINQSMKAMINWEIKVAQLTAKENK
jgi:hypothetical protein